MLLHQWRIQDFPDGGAPTPERGAPTYYLTNFSQKLHENEENLTPEGGARVPAPPPLDPPMYMMFLCPAFLGQLLCKHASTHAQIQYFWRDHVQGTCPCELCAKTTQHWLVPPSHPVVPWCSVEDSTDFLIL